jgi:hypothetical protein
MKMLYDEHSKAGKELQRKIVQLREENKDPSLPQMTVVPTSPSTNATLGSTLRPPSSPPPRRMTDSQQTVDESFMVLGQRVSVIITNCRNVVLTGAIVGPGGRIQPILANNGRDA